MTNKERMELEFYTKVKADVESVKSVIKALQDRFDELEIPKGAAKGLEKALENLNSEIKNFDILAKRGIGDLSDTRKLNASWKKISDYFTGINSQLSDLGEISEKIFPKEVLTNIDRANKALAKYADKIDEIKKSQPYVEKVEKKRRVTQTRDENTKNYERERASYEKEKIKIEAKRDDWNKNRSVEYEKQKKELQNITDELNKQKQILEQSYRDTGVITKSGDITKSHKIKINTAKDLRGEAQSKLEQKRQALKEAEAAEQKAKNIFAGRKGAATKISKDSKADEAKLAQAIKNKAEAEEAYNAAILKTKELREELKKAEEDFSTANQRVEDLQNQSAQASNIHNQISALEEQQKTIQKSIAANENFKDSLEKSEDALASQKTVVDGFKNALDKAQTELESIDNELRGLELTGAASEWSELVSEIQRITGIDLSEFQGDIQQVVKVLEEYRAGEIKSVPELINKIKNVAEEAKTPLGNLRDETDEATDGFKEMSRAAQDVENLKNQVLDFFSITNTIQLFKRALQDAMNTVKELDAVMTETAVVTDFSIGDMWEKLPEYAKQATKLGTSIASLYEATTLYYQQGLQTNEAMGVGIETMKMARIANMDATEATTAMTAALRGFNMEVDEMNAQRVNDVYSELAAITAADTNQIATAMGKTASIAASANMEFETTAAFLAQIIETTQEAPETAGTAMKTIIARFTEVKELFSEGMLTGEDEEGEEININKIDAALRSVGISLKDFLNGSKGMDEIFLELASKWDTLDLATQRYIATTAAGSRQQSRFLAMMSNYDRTMELVTAANNSAGASQEQFNKTTESLDARLQRLKNAWDTFVMGLANDEFLKGAVDTLTWLIERINDLIDLLSGGEGAQKSILSLAIAFGALKTGGALFNSLFEGVKKAATGAGTDGGKIFVDTFKGSLSKNFGKMRDYLKGFFPNKNDWKSLIGKSLKEININDIAGGKSKGFKESLMRDFSVALDTKIEPQSLEKLKNSINNMWDTGKQTEAIETMNRALEQHGVQLEITEQTAKRTTSAMQQGFGKAAAAAMLVTGALNLLSKGLENSGHERGAEGFQILANGISMTASGLIVLPGLLKAVGITASASLGWIGLIAGAVVSLGFAIAKWHESSSEKMERLQKEADEAADAAQKAKESYDALFNAKGDYEETQNTLEDLIKGTDEWRKKLVEANQQILELINTYPELAQYIGRGAEGQLIIKDEGWDTLSKQIEEQVANTQAMSAMANIIVVGEQQEQEREKPSQKFYAYNPMASREQYEAVLDNADVVIGATAQKITSDNFDTLSSDERKDLWRSLGLWGEYEDTDQQKAELRDEIEFEDTVYLYNKEFLELVESTGLVADNLYHSADIIKDYYSYIGKEGLAVESNLAAFLGSSEAASNSKYGDQIARGIAKQNVWDIDDKIEERAKTLKEDKSEADLKEQYKTLTGKEAEGMDETALANAIAKIEIGNELSDQVDTIIQYLDNMGKDNPTAKKIAALISGDPSTLTRADIENVEKLDEDTKQALAEAQGAKNFDELAKSKGFEDEDEYEQHLLEIWQDLITKFDELTTEGLEKVFGTGWDEKDGSVMQNATYNQEKAYMDLIAQILGQQGVEGAKSFVKTFDGILQDESTRSQILSALNTYDFKREGAAEDFISYLKEIGVTIPEDEIKEFTADLKALSAAFRKFDLKTVSEEVKKILDFADDLENRDESKGFTDEEKADLIKNAKAKEEDFVWTGQEWTYLGGTMDTLTQAIRENTSAILEEKRQSLKEQIKTGEEAQKYFGGETGENIQGYITHEEGLPSFYSISREEFLKGKEGSLTPDMLRQIFGLEQSTTDEEAWTKYDEYKFAYENLDTNRVTEAEWDARYGSVADMQKNAQQIGNFIDNNASFTQDEIDALAALAKQYGVSQTAIEKFRNAMNSTNEAEKKAAAMTLRNLTSQKQSEKQYGKTLKKLQEVNEEYNHITEDMPEYEESATKYGEALGLNMADTTNLEYIKDNMDLVRQAAEGNIESIQQLNEELAAEHGLKITAEGNFEPYNEAVLESDALIQDFIAKQLEAGAFELETIEAEQNVKYLVPKEGGGFEYKTFTQGQVVQIVKPKAAESIANSIRQAGGSSGGGGGGGSTQKWENPYDEFYNTVAKINEELRKREQLERQYQRLLNRSTATAQKLSELAHEQVASLELELNTRQGLLEGRERQMKDIESEYSDVGQYANYNEESKQIVIDWELIQGLDGSENEELTSRIEEFISKLEEQEELIEQEVDAIEEIQDTVWEIQQQGKDEYFDLEEKIKEAIVTARQNEIDKLSEINETISNSDAEIIEAMQKSIEKYRQDRENQDTEEQLAEKQRRLLYLQQDTSGANAMEILKLQDEIEKGQQDYTDSLIDQKISELQEQNDEAAKQREKQIEIAQLQLDHYIESGAIWNDVYNLMDQGLNGANGLIRGSELAHLLQTSVGFDGMSVIGQQDWYVELNKQIAQALSYLETGRQIENLGITEGAEVEFIHNGQVLKGIANAEGDVTTADGVVYDNIYQGADGRYYAGANKKPKVEQSNNSQTSQKPEQSTQQSTGRWVAGLTFTDLYGRARQEEFDSIQQAENFFEKEIRKQREQLLSSPGFIKLGENGEIEKSQKSIEELKNLERGARSSKNIWSYQKKFKTGGLADFTGPAWLDGTKARPEIVLDAQDSRNFIQLRDILGSLLNRSTTSTSTENNGDITYDIDINVEKIDNDYDLEQVANKVKSLITDNARYRNNNAVSIKR